MTQARRTDAGQAGYSLVELLVSTAIMLTVTGAIFSLMNPAQGNSKTQPEVADMQQRMRVGNETLFKELMMAGAGPYQGPVTGALVNFFAPILPRRVGRTNPDAPTVFRDDTITLTYIPNSYSQTIISSAMPNVSAELKVTNQNNCPGSDQLCGFHQGMDVIIFDTTGNFDMFTITEVQADAAHLQHRGQDMSIAYNIGASVTQIVSNTFYLDQQAHKLMRYNLNDQDVPIVDDVVDLKFEYFGDPNPPLAPKPPAGIANCLYDAAGNYRNLPVLPPDEGSLARLTPAMLTDANPMCGGGTNAFDPDLLRIRKVRVTMRVQVADPSLRGNDATLWKVLGSGRTSSGERYVPDYALSFEVSPRNLNLVR